MFILQGVVKSTEKSDLLPTTPNGFGKAASSCSAPEQRLIPNLRPAQTIKGQQSQQSD